MRSTARRNVDRPLGSENGLRLGPETPHLRALAQFSLANIPVVPPKARYLQKRGVLSLRQRAFAGESSRIELSMAIPSSPAIERRRLLGLRPRLPWRGRVWEAQDAFARMDQQQSRCRYCSSNEEDRHRAGYAASNDGRYRYAHMINSRGYRLARLQAGQAPASAFPGLWPAAGGEARLVSFRGSTAGADGSSPCL
ncbi:hypothetical protein CTAM01_07603 [Colletotrichum tamarilloi]|uniref:Uncharacterized protein n=1 Tax=Colletotrichum tamarilloi TaxID=1209934 RepID=A0ABQ9R8G0_9PEZI|nr:uncharacterized protein CTAM01_07603 [Colletotrichum tamarilloi]KAK1497966.1 hypothetical protein CTAM01_07603 [Colletotrichum tamarilloi]